ncbi:hypothetical protein [Breoghania sp.]|uniref:hypothetical protein n=1 Tax=Breoghania sp. TaxID=2065378 RepID=UPI002609B493|nr:hypothetical protein [Breoghania sp.]MDJ0933224.1 hypothetical protein [Breoghania sp.]
MARPTRGRLPGGGRWAGLFSPAYPPYARLVPTLSLSAPLTARDVRTLADDRHTVRLAFVNLPREGTFCVDQFFNRGRCREMGRVALERLVAPIGVECRPIFYPAGEIRYQCFAGSVDVARRQIAEAFVGPDGLAASLRASRERERGCEFPSPARTAWRDRSCVTRCSRDGDAGRSAGNPAILPSATNGHCGVKAPSPGVTFLLLC